MSTQVEVVYPSISTFSGAGQLDLGPYFVPLVKTLLRAEVRGQVNYQGVTVSDTSVFANFPLWALQWVPHGDPPNDVVTTADGPQWLIRQQLGTSDYDSVWAPTTDSAASIGGSGLNADWAGQQAISQSIDLYLSMRAPTGASLSNLNLFGSIRFWWSGI